MLLNLLLIIVIFSLIISHLNIDDSNETNTIKKYKNKIIIIVVFILLCVVFYIKQTRNKKFINETYDSILKKIKLKKIAKK